MIYGRILPKSRVTSRALAKAGPNNYDKIDAATAVFSWHNQSRGWHDVYHTGVRKYCYVTSVVVIRTIGFEASGFMAIGVTMLLFYLPPIQETVP